MSINTTEIIEVSAFLNFFKIDLETYFNLSKVPFPVITERGRVVYFHNGVYKYYDHTDSTPSDTDVTRISRDNILKHCFIDFGQYVGGEEFRHRFERSTTDRNRCDIKNATITTQTAASSCNLTYTKHNGVLINSLALQSDSYPFTSLDLINSVAIDYVYVNSPNDYKGVYDIINNLIRIDPINSSTQSQENNQMSIVTTAIDKNKEALITATKLEVGNIALDLVTKQLVKALPEPMQLLVGQSPLIKIAIANLANVVVSQLNVEDQRLVAVNEAMLTVAYTETIRTFNIQEIIENALSGIPKGSLDLITGAQASTS